MKIYYINSDEFLHKYDLEFLNQYSDKEIKSHKKYIQHCIGRFLIKSAGEKDYNISNTEIELKNQKPKFKYSDIKFSLTHCDKYIVSAFDKNECGLDIEKIKPRNIIELSRYFKKDFQSLKDFYYYWTEYEASLKLQQKVQWKYSTIFQNDYILTAVSVNPNLSTPEFINLL